MTMLDCTSTRADKCGPNVCKLVMQSLKDRHREESEQESDVERSGDGVYRNGEWLRLISIRDFERKIVENGGPNMR